eukprot:TRINITY_DN12480_c0_g1_i1.p1 TRINITY_DN12480_c0_g1~~TRINITY_DN12480_c0_g1_i1.p1  ORF type:complete len:127 (+),score=25.40 TRINITY_DN12480_c0_g1_i1:1-381(+)
MINKNLPFKQPNSHDVHFYFTQETHQSAMTVRTNLKTEFPILTFYQPSDGPLGPHPIPMWEADFKRCDGDLEIVQQVVDWLKENRNGHSVLVHPHTGDGDLADHSRNALWLGEPVELRVEFLTGES